MKVNISREGRFIPEWRDNRKEPEGEQIVVTYSNLSHEERAKYESKEKPIMTMGDIAVKTDEEIDREIDEQVASIQVAIDNEPNEKVAAAMKPTLANLEDEAGNAIATWDALLKIPMTSTNQISSLIDEIRTHLVKEAREKDLGNSE